MTFSSSRRIFHFRFLRRKLGSSKYFWLWTFPSQRKETKGSFWSKVVSLSWTSFHKFFRRITVHIDSNSNFLTPSLSLPFSQGIFYILAYTTLVERPIYQCVCVIECKSSATFGENHSLLIRSLITSKVTYSAIVSIKTISTKERRYLNYTWAVKHCNLFILLRDTDPIFVPSGEIYFRPLLSFSYLFNFYKHLF